MKETRRVKIVKKCKSHDSISECGDCGKKMLLFPADESILGLIYEIQEINPKWRFGQIIANAVRYYDGRVNCDPFYISDKDLLDGLKKLRNL